MIGIDTNTILAAITPQTMYYIAFYGVVAVMFLVTTFATTKWISIKNKITYIRKLVVAVDDAVYDDNVTEAEFRLIFSKFTTEIA